jgi:hypothetical protein
MTIYLQQVFSLFFPLRSSGFLTLFFCLFYFFQSGSTLAQEFSSHIKDEDGKPLKSFITTNEPRGKVTYFNFPMPDLDSPPYVFLYTRFEKAILRNQLELVETIVEATPEVLKRKDPHPLALAIMNNSISMIRKLIQLGMNPNEDIIPGVSPLGFAIHKEFPHAVWALLQEKADPHSKIGKLTVLDFAKHKGELESADLLMRAIGDGPANFPGGRK